MPRKLLFMFENVPLSLIKEVFQRNKFILGSGSIARRQCLTTNQFLLSGFLSNMGYTLNDVIQALRGKLMKIINIAEDIQIPIYGITCLFSKNTYLNILLEDLYINKENISQEIEENKNKLNQRKNKKAVVESKINNRDIADENAGYNVTVYKLNVKITSPNGREHKIKTNSNKLRDIESKISEIPNLEPTNLHSLYVNRCKSDNL